MRTELFKKDYSEWSEDDKEQANRVCASYDQAGILLSAGVVNPKTAKGFLSSSWGQSIVDQYESLEPFVNDKQTPTATGREFFHHLLGCITKLKNTRQECIMNKIAFIRSGGQTGVDRLLLIRPENIISRL